MPQMMGVGVGYDGIQQPLMYSEEDELANAYGMEGQRMVGMGGYGLWQNLCMCAV